jgi:hypothetical protein
MIDVQQIALALRACTRQSLIIVDEFGKGTGSNGSVVEVFAYCRWRWLILCGVGIFSQIGR